MSGRFHYIDNIRVLVHRLPLPREAEEGQRGEPNRAEAAQGHPFPRALLLPIPAAHQLGFVVHRLHGGHVRLLARHREFKSGLVWLSLLSSA